MMEGRVKVFKDDEGYGFIKPAGGGEDIFVHHSDISGRGRRTLCKGQRVTFDVTPGKKGLRAINVKVVEDVAAASDSLTDDNMNQGGQPVASASAASVGSQASPNPYRFLNPYNFVRFLPSPTAAGAESPESKLLGKCAPPPHDRYVGITGKITCTAETITPLFIPDPDIVDEDENTKHKTYRFFRLDDQPVIPLTELRGEVRNIFEAVTNSCFVTIGDAQLDYRLSARKAPDLRAAVVTKLPDVGKKTDGEVLILRSAWTHHTLIKQAAAPSSSLKDHFNKAKWTTENPYNSYPRHVLKNQLLPIQAEVKQNARRRTVITSYKQYPKFDEVTKIIKTGNVGDDLLSLKPNANNFWGYLKITGPNVVKEKNGALVLGKHDERFFYWDGSTTSTATIPWQDVTGRANACERYDEVREAQKEPANQQLEYVTYLQNETLTVGDLVWVEVEDTATGRVVSDIGSVSIPKLRYKHTILDLLPEHLRPCSKYEELCPACRVFGWVRGKSDDDQNARVAYAGRVSFSHGTLDGEPATLGRPVTLAILSSPKPTTTPFYLLNKDGDPDFGATYNTDGAQLRGRKMYRHHSKVKEQEYERAKDHRYTGKDEQNRTVIDALEGNGKNKFTFTINFENLAPAELGALLWSLEMDGKGFHQVGYAKPLGFGSMKFTIKDDICVLDPKARYVSLSDDGWTQVPRTKWEKCVVLFKQELAKRYGKAEDEFHSLENVEDLLAILTDTTGNLPVHYPRSQRQPHPEGKQYEWFIGNRKLEEDRIAGKSSTGEKCCRLPRRTRKACG